MISYHATQTRTLVFFWLLLVGYRLDGQSFICAVRGLPTKPCPDGSTQCILRHLVHRGLINDPQRHNLGHGRQLSRGAQRPNDKFRPDCWSEDEGSPPPPMPRSQWDEPQKNGRQKRGSRQNKAIRSHTRQRGGNAGVPCIWEVDSDYPQQPDYPNY